MAELNELRDQFVAIEQIDRVTVVGDVHRAQVGRLGPVQTGIDAIGGCR